jgi:hypothetical protein
MHALPRRNTCRMVEELDRSYFDCCTVINEAVLDNLPRHPVLSSSGECPDWHGVPPSLISRLTFGASDPSKNSAYLLGPPAALGMAFQGYRGVAVGSDSGEHPETHSTIRFVQNGQATSQL